MLQSHAAVPPDLVDRYLADGLWTNETLGTMVADGLASRADVEFNVHSSARPWRGTFADVDRAARSLATSLSEEGVEPGDVVMFQLPNWVEAGITFWASAYLGAVVVPVVHFYGPKEVRYILDAVAPKVLVTPDRFGHNDYLETYDNLLVGTADEEPLWLVTAAVDADLPRRATGFATMLDSDPMTGPIGVDPDAPAIVAFTSGTTHDPKGVVHSHRTIACETHQLDHMFPKGGPAQIIGAPVGHFIGMVNALLIPLSAQSSREPPRCVGPCRSAPPHG